MKKKNYFPTEPEVVVRLSDEKIQEALMKQACERVVRDVKEATKYGKKEIRVHALSGMTIETKRRFWTDLEEWAGTESLSLFNGMIYQTDPPQYEHLKWDVESAIHAQHAWFKI